MALNLTLHQSTPSKCTSSTDKATKSVVRHLLTYSPVQFAAHQARADNVRKHSNPWVLALVIAFHLAMLAYMLLHVRVQPEPIEEVPIEVSLINESSQAPMIKTELLNQPQPPLQKTKPTPPQPTLDRLPLNTTPTPQPIASESKANTPTPEVNHEQTTTEAKVTTPTKPTDSKAALEIEKPAPKEDVIEPPKFGVAYLNNPKPNYPNLSRRAGERGRVLLKVLVDVNGLPEIVEIGTSSGFERLDNAALTAVKQWKFVPASKNNQAMSAWVTVPISFALD